MNHLTRLDECYERGLLRKVAPSNEKAMQSLAQAREWVTEAGFDCDAGAESLYRIRVGEYRIIYQVLHESREVIVSSIRHRSVAYRGV